MKLTAEYDQLELDFLLTACNSRLTHLMSERNRSQHTFGRGHEHTILLGRAVARANSVAAKLRADVDQAKRTPASSRGTYDGGASPGAAVADSMGLVYGRPRNDPRDYR